MKPLKNSTRFALALALLVPGMGLIWMFAAPATISLSTFAILAAVLTAFAAITLKTYHDGQADGSVGQLIHETDVAPLAAPAKTAARTGAAR